MAMWQMRLRAPVLACAAMWSFIPWQDRTATAQGVPRLSVSLTYEHEPTLRGCPSEEEFRRELTNQLGYDPFGGEATHHVTARVEEAERAIEGQIVWTDAGGAKEGERRLSSANHDCVDLVRDMAFALAVQIQLLNSSAVSEKPPAELSPVPVVEGAAPPKSESRVLSSAIESPKAERYVLLGLGPTIAIGQAPSVSPGARFFVSGRSGAISLELGGEGYLSVRSTQGDGSGISTSSFAGTLALCGHLRQFALCPVGVLGQLRVVGFGVDDVRSPTSITARAGLRLAVEQPLSQRLLVVLDADGLGMLTPRTAYLNDLPVWTTPALAFTLAIELATRFR